MCLRLPRLTSGSFCLALFLASLAAASCAGGGRAESHLDRADGYAKAGKLPEARIEYLQALKLSPRLGEARLGLARTELRLGNSRAALAEFSRAADLLPNDEAAQLEAGQMLFAAGRYRDSADRASRALLINPRSVSAFILRANSWLLLRQPDEALADAQQAATLDPEAVPEVLPNLALIQLAAGQTAEASATLDRAVKLPPKSTPNRLSLARVLWITGRLAEAEAAFTAAAKADPSDQTANREAGAFFAATGRPKLAEPYFTALAARASDSGARLDLAEFFVGLGEFDRALEVLKPLRERPESRDAADTRTASLLLARGDTAAAGPLLDGVLQRAPRHVPALVLKARILAYERKLDEAEKLVTTALGLDPASAEAHHARGVIMAASGRYSEARSELREALSLSPKSIESLVQLARLELVRGDPREAVTYAQDALRVQPGNVDARGILVDALLRAGDSERARSEIAALAEAHPDSAVVQTRRGVMLAGRGDRQGARRAFEEALRLDPRSAEALAGLVGLDLGAKDVAAARRRLASVPSERAEDPLVLKLKARVELSAGNADGAETVLRRLVELQPSDLDTYDLLVGLYVRQGKLAEARRELEGVISRNPRNVGAQTTMGILLTVAGDSAGAMRHFQAAVDADPRAGVAANNLAWMTADSGGNLDVALNLAQSAKSAMPDRHEVDDTLAFVYLKKGQAPLALGPAKESVRKDPRNPAYHYRLGVAFQEAGDDAKARASLEEALRLSSTFDGAADARQRLQRLSKG